MVRRENNQLNSENINDVDNALLSSGNNQMSFENSALLLRDLFDPAVIAGDLITYFS